MGRHAERFFPPGFLMSCEKPELKGTGQGLQPSPCHYVNFPSVQLVHQNQNCFRIDSTDLNCENKRTLYWDFCTRQLILMLLWGSIITSVHQCKIHLCLSVSFVVVFPLPLAAFSEPAIPWLCRSPFCNMWSVVRKILKIMHLLRTFISAINFSSILWHQYSKW